ncbi:E3 ubiquitin-protein ligase TRIM39-like [Gadus morhua]|uniref:E3 ubiquitin-protein ligase TRIM39-like n=1 Tax=Gadus morhua TaxID=8049 RepID=UPI0011B7B204|nr:E3 ubiquitin-protein ligase TRIM39-like [Gadus morhua]
MACANAPWSEENLSCSICLDVFSSPVSTPCGHNFCRTCITKYWDEQVKYKCPVCNELFNTRPDLRVNILFSEMVDRFGPSVRVKEQPFVEPAEVPCDVCTEERLKSTEKQAEGLIKDLEQEIEDLTNRSSEVKQLSHTKDHLHFLQAFRSLKDPPHTRDWTTVEVRPPSYIGTLRRSLDQLEETLNMEMKKLRDAELKRVQQYEVDVTLDPDTALPSLILSEDGKQVHHGDVVKKLPGNPKRFTLRKYVLTRQSFSSGRFYFEVQVKDKTAWCVGVARESIHRIGEIIETPETGYWILYYGKGVLVFNDAPDVHLPLRAELQKVGVFVDYDEGLVSFYDVEARVHIYSATACTFSEPLYPILNPCTNHGGKNSAPLIISPVNQTD